MIYFPSVIITFVQHKTWLGGNAEYVFWRFALDWPTNQLADAQEGNGFQFAGAIKKTNIKKKIVFTRHLLPFYKCTAGGIVAFYLLVYRHRTYLARNSD